VGIRTAEIGAKASSDAQQAIVGSPNSNVSRVVEQLDLARVEQRQQVLVEIRFRAIGRLIGDAVPGDSLDRPLPAVAVADDQRDAVGPIYLGKFGGYLPSRLRPSIRPPAS